MSQSDFLTIHAVARPTGGRIRWRRSVRTFLAGGVEGLRGATVNYSNNATHTVRRRWCSWHTDRHTGGAHGSSRTAYEQPGSHPLLGRGATGRWDIELIALGQLGVCRFDGLQQQLGISRKVLSERLKHLVAKGFFERRQVPVPT